MSFIIIQIQNAAKEIMEWIVRNHVGIVPIYPTVLMWTGLVIPDVVLDISTISAKKVWVFVSLVVNLYSFIQSFINETALKIILHSIFNLILKRCFNMTSKWFAYKFAITPYILVLFCFSCNLKRISLLSWRFDYVY